MPFVAPLGHVAKELLITYLMLRFTGCCKKGLLLKKSGDTLGSACLLFKYLGRLSLAFTVGAVPPQMIGCTTYRQIANSRRRGLLQVVLRSVLFVCIITSTLKCDSAVEDDPVRDISSVFFAQVYDDVNGNLYRYTLRSDSSGALYDQQQIPGVHSLADAYFDRDRNLLIAATPEYLLFIDAANNQIVKTLAIPDTEATEAHTDYWNIELLPYNDEHFLLSNRSIYLVNLNTMSIESKVFDALAFERSIILSEVKLSEDKKHLYLKYDVRGVWVEEGIGHLQTRIRFSSISISSGEMLTFHEERSGTRGTYDTLLPTQQYLLVVASIWGSNETMVYRYSNSTGAILDSVQLAPGSFFSHGITHRGRIFLHELRSSSIYELDPATLSLERAVTFETSSNMSAGFFYDKRNDQLVAALYLPSQEKGVIINLTTRESLREIPAPYPTRIFLMED